MNNEEIRRLQAEHWARPASEYQKSGKYHGPTEAPKDDPEKARALILESFKRPVELPDSVFSLDVKIPKPSGRRGRPESKSPYDRYIKALRGAMYRQTKLPNLRKGTGRSKQRMEQLTAEVLKIAHELQSKGKRVTALTVERRLITTFKGAWTPDGIQKSLASLRKNKLIHNRFI